MFSAPVADHFGFLTNVHERKLQEAFVSMAGATIIVSAANGLWVTPSIRQILHAPQIQESLFRHRGLY